MSDKPLFDLESKIREWIEKRIEEASMKWKEKGEMKIEKTR